MQTRAHIPPTGRYEKRGAKDTIQGNRAMAVVGGGDVAGEKCINQIEPTTAVVGTVGVAMDGGEVRAKGKMSGWRTMQGNQAAEDTMGEGVRRREAIGWQRMQQEGGRTTQGNHDVDDTKRREGRTLRTQQNGG
jgi:hypothetical protein